MSLPALAPLLRLLVAVTLLLAAFLARAEGIHYKVEIDGPREVRELLASGLSLQRWENDPDMTPELLSRLLDEALSEVKQAIATRGYFSPRISGTIERGTDPWTVRIEVDPGEHTIVRTLDVSVRGPAASDPEASKLIEAVKHDFLLHTGQPFTQGAWDDAKVAAARQLASWRYAAAKVVKSEARIEPGTASAHLVVELDSGPPFRLGDIVVNGAKRYPDQVVVNLSPVNPGETYDREKLRVYERKLQESGYFASAQASVDPDPALAQAAPVRVVVIEGLPRTLELGLSYNTDTALRTLVQLHNNDVFGSAWRLGSQLRFDSKTQNLRFDLDSPPRADASWNNHFVSLQEQDIQKETTRDRSAGFAHNWGFETTPSALLVSGHLEDQIVQANGVASALQERRHALFIGYRRTARKTDDLLAPRSGYQATFELGGAPSALATREFTRFYGKLLMFKPLGRNDDLLLRGELGHVFAGSNRGIPSTFVFRTGGDQTLRGYAFQSIGAQLGDAVVGGRRLVIGSAEAIHWFAESWGLAAFVDAGDAWDPSGRGYKTKLGYGTGARFKTPIGPVRADLAYGRESREFRLHFSIGFTF